MLSLMLRPTAAPQLLVKVTRSFAANSVAADIVFSQTDTAYDPTQHGALQNILNQHQPLAA